MGLEEYKGVYVFAQQVDNELSGIAFELLGKAKELASDLGTDVTAVLIGSDVKGLTDELAEYGADKVIVVDDPELKEYRTEPYTHAIASVIEEFKPEIFLIGATAIGRDLGPRVCARIHTGLTADCTKLDIGDFPMNPVPGRETKHNQLLMTRPAFGGNTIATIACPDFRPQMATVREGVMKKEILDADYKGEVINHDVAKYVPETDYVVKVIDRHVEKAKHNLKGAPIVIAGGYGMGSKEGFDMLFELAKELHAEVGASRAAVDAGYADHDRQIGQTGVTVRPKLYIACGISGQIQHIAGMQESGIIISINNDENAPINTIADYVINGTVEEVIPKMIKYYKSHSK